MSLWMVRAGRHGQDEESALEMGLAIIGFREFDDLSSIDTKEEVIKLLKEKLPDKNDNAINNHAAQLYAFLKKIKTGDLVTIPLKTRPHVAIGEIAGDYKYIDINGEMRHTRKVKWIKIDILRTIFGQDMLYSLGAFSTICRIKRNNAEERFKVIAEGKEDPGKIIDETNDTDEVAETRQNIAQVANDEVMSYLEKHFKGHSLERLVDAILQAEGFTTDLVKPGPDGGVDILAGKGDLGFGHPRICVQVKSSSSPVDANVLRSLQGVLKPFGADYGLVVAWGGFNSTALKEARQNFFNIRLWNSRDILDAIQRNYEKFSEELQKELPMKRMWVMVQDEDE